MSELDSVSLSAVNASPNASNSSVIDYDAMQQTWLRVVLISLYVVIFVLGVAGNSLVVYIVGGGPRRRAGGLHRGGTARHAVDHQHLHRQPGRV